MAKKRKVETLQSQSTIADCIPTKPDSSLNEESVTSLHEDPKSEGSWAPETGEDDPESLQKLLEPFNKDQIVDILRQAISNHPDILMLIRQIADLDPAHRKVFVHGLGWNTTAETLADAFRQFGEIEDCHAIVDKITGRSKGYGFVLFKHRNDARRALKEPQKKIGSKMAACQLASAGPLHIPPPIASTTPPFPLASEYTQRKIYVSNVGSDLDPQKLLQFFSKFGEIDEGPLGLDKETGKPKGFCIFTYKNAEGAKKTLQEPYKTFEGHILHCQKAFDGPKFGKQGFHGVQYSSLQQAQSGFGSQKIVRMPSSVPGPGHLIAPPAQNLRFNQGNQLNSSVYNTQLGMPTKNGGLMGNTVFSNQVGGAGSYITPGVTLRIHGGYNNAAFGQGIAWAQQGFGRAGCARSSTGQ